MPNRNSKSDKKPDIQSYAKEIEKFEENAREQAHQEYVKQFDEKTRKEIEKFEEELT